MTTIPQSAGEESQRLVLQMTAEEMRDASMRASDALEAIFARAPAEEVVKRLFLNMHGVLTALCGHMHGDTIQSIIREFLLVNVATVQAAIDANNATEDSTKH